MGLASCARSRASTAPSSPAPTSSIHRSSVRSRAPSRGKHMRQKNEPLSPEKQAKAGEVLFFIAPHMHSTAQHSTAQHRSIYIYMYWQYLLVFLLVCLSAGLLACLSACSRRLQDQDSSEACHQGLDQDCIWHICSVQSEASHDHCEGFRSRCTQAADL